MLLADATPNMRTGGICVLSVPTRKLEEGTLLALWWQDDIRGAEAVAESVIIVTFSSLKEKVMISCP